jgi:hypothetical protein
MEKETLEGEELEEFFNSLMGKETKKVSKKATSQVEDTPEKPKTKRRTRKAPIIPDPLPKQTPPLPDSP